VRADRIDIAAIYALRSFHPSAALTAKGGTQGVAEVASLSPGERGGLAGVIHEDVEVFGKWVGSHCETVPSADRR